MDKVYVVAGYMNTGSGSLTYPEDFDTIGFFETRKEAQDHADELNDAADVGFFVQGRREKRLYTLVEEKKHDDGEFFAWVFADVDRPGNKIFVYND